MADTGLFNDALRDFVTSPTTFVDTTSGEILVFKGGVWKKCARLNDRGYIVHQHLFCGKPHNILIHRAIFLASRGSITRGHHIDHINGVKTDNRAVNLREVDASTHQRLTKQRVSATRRSEAWPPSGGQP